MHDTSRRNNWQLYQQGVDSETRYVCHCSVLYEIRGRYHCLFKQGFGPPHKVMEYKDQQCLGLFLLELKRHKGKLFGQQYNHKTSS